VKKILSIFSLIFLFATSIGYSLDEVSYSQENAKKYAKFGIEGTSWLSFRDVPFYVKKYVKGKKTLDLGCGAGRSTWFLKSLGLDVVGVDICEQYLKEAVFIDPNTHFFLLEKGKIPSIENSYDFVFSSFVLIMIPTKEELQNTVKEVCRVLKKDGIFIVITGSEEMHSIDKKWLSYETNFSENKSPKLILTHKSKI
jgi:ubiquinone/menaquinone biosynthesis C-methylase UbiE